MTAPSSLAELNESIESAIQSIFSASAPPVTVYASESAGARYELYTYLLLAEYIQSQVANMHFYLTNGVFKFRGSPGKVDNSAFSYAEFSINGNYYQLRNGIEFSGHNMNHEVDVSISLPLTDKSLGERESLIVAIECKYYASVSGLKGVLRESVGAALDLSPDSHDGVGCLHCGAIPFFLFLSQHQIVRPDFLGYLRTYKIFPVFDFGASRYGGETFQRIIDKFLVSA